MGLFRPSKEEAEEIRGVLDSDLPKLTNEQIIMLAIARLYDAGQADDDALMEDLYRRGRGK